MLLGMSQANPLPAQDEAGVVHVGDAWDLLGELDPETVDLILTSPPYWGLRDYGLDHNENVLADWLKQGGEAAVAQEIGRA